MAHVALSKRYAKALLQIGQASEAGLDDLVEELRSFDDAMGKSVQLRTVLTTPGLPLSVRQGLLRELLSGAGASLACTNTLLLLTEENRLSILGEIVQAVRVEADKAAGRVRARVTSAARLSAAQIEQIKAAFQARTGKRIVVEAAVDEALIGGVVAQIGSIIYDGSIKSQLRRLRDELSQGASA